MTLIADKKDYLRAFHKHYKAYIDWKESVHDDSRSIILFYCVECGLKFLLMKKLRIFRIKDANKPIHNMLTSHNLSEILKELRMNQFSFPIFKTNHNDDVSLKEYHQMKRYSIRAKSENDYQIIERYDKQLYDIAQWIITEGQG